MRVLRNLLVANLKQFVRERAALFRSFAFPIIFILIFGAVFSGTNDISFSVGLVMNDDSPPAQTLSEVLQQVPAFELNIGSEDSELQALREGDRGVVIVVSSDFGEVISQ